MASNEVTIREAKEEDCEELARSIQELADFFNESGKPKLDAGKLREDGFGDSPRFRCIVADHDGKVVGHAMYYFSYSAWSGKNIFLDDLYVKPAFRHYGIGTRLLKEVSKTAITHACTRVDLLCNSWNKLAIEFYQAKGACDLTDADDWHLLRFDQARLEELGRI